MSVVVFGAGYWGRNYVKELGRRCVAVVDPNPQTHWAIQQLGVRTFAELPDSLEFDAAVIATPPDTHVPIALSLLERDKYVLIEKPIAHSYAEVQQLVPHSRRCMCGFIYLYNPGVLTLCENLQERRDIDHIFIRRTNDGPVRNWQDATWDLAVHDVSIAMHCFGMPQDVWSVRTRNWGLLRLRHYTTNVLIYASWRGGPKVRQIEVVFENDPNRLVFDDVATVHEVSPMRRMLNEFLTGDWDHRGSVEFALNVTAVMEAAYK